MTKKEGIPFKKYSWFSLTWSTAMFFNENKKKHLHNNIVHFPEDWVRTPTWQPWLHEETKNRPNRLTQCCTQFKSPGIKILCVLYLHDNVAFIFKWYGNTWNKTFYSQRVQHWVSQLGLYPFDWINLPTRFDKYTLVSFFRSSRSIRAFA